MNQLELDRAEPLRAYEWSFAARIQTLGLQDMTVIEEWDITAVNLRRAAKRDYQIAVLAVGAIEPHNRHLPEGHDFRHTTYVARRCCELAWPQCESVICLPTLPFGVDCNLMAFPLAIHVSQAVLDAMIRDIIVSLRTHGIGRILIVNGHGGNDFMPLVRQVQCDLDVHVFVSNWWKVGHDKYDEIFEKPDDHGGEFETSVALALYPELVEMQYAGTGEARPFRFEALTKGWVQTSRDFAKLNDHCGVGNPEAATAEKGRKYLELVCQRLSSFIVQVATEDSDCCFPQVP